MCNLLKILKQLGSKPTVKDIEVNEPEVIQPKKEDKIKTIVITRDYEFK